MQSKGTPTKHPLTFQWKGPLVMPQKLFLGAAQKGERPVQIVQSQGQSFCVFSIHGMFIQILVRPSFTGRFL